jgi:hypothetical protein
MKFTAPAPNGTATDRPLFVPTPEQVEAAAAYLADHWPAKGRQILYRPLCGGLLRHVEEQSARTLVEQLVVLTDDEEGEKRLQLFDATAQKLKDDDPVSGWPKLTKQLGAEVVGQFKVRLGLCITLDQLGTDKKLPIEFLRGLGLHDLDEGGVGIPYHDAAGRTVAVKQRTRLVAGEGSYWPTGQPLLAYGEDHLEDAHRLEFLTLVEGESDCWTLWFHGQPALGLPGAETVHKTLCLGHVDSVRTIYVVREPDQAGVSFVENVRRRLGELGWSGTLKMVALGDAKDPSELHCRNADTFLRSWQVALASAESLEVGAAPAPAAPPILPTDPPWPDDLAEEAFHGLAGDIVRTIGPASEADPAALLLQVLVGVGNLIGRTAHFRAEADAHYLNEFVVLLGRTAKSRKGSSWGQVRGPLAAVDEEWGRDRIQTGLSSGQGLIWAVRDPSTKRERVPQRGEAPRYEEVEADPGVCDKRLLVFEPEFASVLRQVEQQGNILSIILRQAWESDTLRTMTKHDPTRATGAHISLIAHCTVEEVRRYLSKTEIANGFGNRHLWLCVERSKVLPEGGAIDPGVMTGLQERLGEAIAFARGVGTMRRDDEAREVWRDVYEDLSEGRPGMAGALLARGEAHVMRLACLYAVLDFSKVVKAEHLLAALALWQYVEQSVRHVFGDALGDPVADELLRLLRAAPSGMTRNELLNAFGRNLSSDRIGRCLSLLAQHRLARFEKQETGGRPAERWFAGAGS